MDYDLTSLIIVEKASGNLGSRRKLIYRRTHLFNPSIWSWSELRRILWQKPPESDTADSRATERLRRTILSGLAAVLARGVWALSLILSVPLTLGYLGQERYGLWMTVTSLLTLLQFADFGIGNGLLNAVARATGNEDELDARRNVSSAFFSLLAIASFGGIVFAMFYSSINWASLYNVSEAQAIADSGPVTAAFALTFLLALPLGVVGRTQQGFQEGYLESLWQALGRVFGLVVVVLAVTLDLGLPILVLGFVGAPVLTQAANNIAYFYFQRPAIRPALGMWDRQVAANVIRTGFLFFALQLVVAVAFAADTLILAQMLGPVAVAVYTISFQLFSFVPMLVRVFLLPLWPAYGEATARGDQAWVESTFRKALRSSLQIGVPVAAGLVVAGTFIIRLWTGSIVDPPILLLVALGINAVILYGWGDPVAMYLNGTSKVRFEVAWAIPMAIVNLPLSILLTSVLGISGPAWGTSIAYFLLMLVPTTVYLRRWLNAKPRPKFSSTHDAILHLRTIPYYSDLIRDTYLGADADGSLERFRNSAEFAQVKALLGDISNKTVLDLGTGNGIAAAALADAGAQQVIALDPDLSDQIGGRAASRMAKGKPIAVVSALGERLPLGAQIVDVIYSRQVLHHAQDLPGMVAECFRVLRPGGTFLSTRDHVVDDENQLQTFLSEHPVHQLAGGENAYSQDEYVNAFRSAGFNIEQTIGPWDSVINAFPIVRSELELQELPETLLRQRLGSTGALLAKIPGVSGAIRTLLRGYRRPGRMYSFLVRKPI